MIIFAVVFSQYRQMTDFAMQLQHSTNNIKTNKNKYRKNKTTRLKLVGLDTTGMARSKTLDR